MSNKSTFNILASLDEYSAWVRSKLDFYDAHLTSVLVHRNSLGVAGEIDTLGWSEQQVRHYKLALTLVQACDTPLTGTLRLLCSGVVSESIGVARVLLEAYSVIKWCNADPLTRWQEYNDAFFTDNDEDGQSKRETIFLSRVNTDLRSESEEMKDVFKYFNNFGAHLSRDKIIANVSTQGGYTAPNLIKPGTFTIHMGRGFDAIAVLTLNIVEEYARFMDRIGVAKKVDIEECSLLRQEFMESVRPKLVGMVSL